MRPLVCALCKCVFTEGQLCSPILTNSPGTSHILSPKHRYTRRHTHTHTQILGDQCTSLPPYCQDCVYVEADNTTGLNPSTCDFLQTGLVPVSLLNSLWNTGKSRAAGWSAGHGPNPLFHVLNAPLLLSKWTALLWMRSTSVPRWCALQHAAMWTEKPSWKCTGSGEAHTTECPAMRKKHLKTNPVLFHILRNTFTHTHIYNVGYIKK